MTSDRSRNWWLVDLDHPQAPVVVLVDKRLHAGGFAGAAVAVEQDVVGRAAGEERLRVVPELALLQLVAHQVREQDAVHVVDGQELHVLPRPPDAEGPVKAEHPHAVGPVVIRDDGEHLLLIRRRSSRALTRWIWSLAFLL
jgi:hypothetical protein